MDDIDINIEDVLNRINDQKKNQKNRVFLAEVKELSFHRSRFTSHRRTESIPQLKCLSIPIDCDNVDINYVRCRNIGIPGSNSRIPWECVAEMPDTYEFSFTEVNCEGFDSSKDPYVLKDSCGLVYEVRYKPFGGHNTHAPNNPTIDNFVKNLFICIWCGVAAYILYGFVKNYIYGPTSTSNRSQNTDDSSRSGAEHFSDQEVGTPMRSNVLADNFRQRVHGNPGQSSSRSNVGFSNQR